MALTKSANQKRKSGRKTVALLLMASKCCKCGVPAQITKAVDTNRGTKWKHFCADHRPKEA